MIDDGTQALATAFEDTLEEHKAEEQNTSSKRDAAHDEQISTLGIKISELKRENDDLKKRLANEITQQETARTKEFSHLKAVITKLETESEERLSRLENDKPNLQQRLDNAERKCAVLQASLDRLDTERNEAIRKIEAKQHELLALQEDTRIWTSKTMCEVTRHESQLERLDGQVKEGRILLNGIKRHFDMDFVLEDALPRFNPDDLDDVFLLPPMLPPSQPGQPEASKKAKGKDGAPERRQEAAPKAEIRGTPAHNRSTPAATAAQSAATSQPRGTKRGTQAQARQVNHTTAEPRAPRLLVTFGGVNADGSKKEGAALTIVINKNDAVQKDRHAIDADSQDVIHTGTSSGLEEQPAWKKRKTGAGTGTKTYQANRVTEETNLPQPSTVAGPSRPFKTLQRGMATRGRGWVGRPSGARFGNQRAATRNTADDSSEDVMERDVESEDIQDEDPEDDTFIISSDEDSDEEVADFEEEPSPKGKGKAKATGTGRSTRTTRAGSPKTRSGKKYA
jgi:hypothetical protein